MKTKTILDAMVIAIQDYYKVKWDIPFLERRLRQIRAFRERILRLDAELRREVEELNDSRAGWMDVTIDIEKQLAAKDARIAELEKWVKDMTSYFRIDE
jgi:hypothetical protein